MKHEPIAAAYHEIVYGNVFVGRNLPRCMICNLLLLEVMTTPDYAANIHMRLRKLLTCDDIVNESIAMSSALAAGAKAVSEFGYLPRPLAKPDVDHCLRTLRRIL